jgi:uracil-DNA glycosylase
LAQPTGSAFRDALNARIRFYRDLGITEFYRRPVDAAAVSIESGAPGPPVGALDANREKEGAPGPCVGTWDGNREEQGGTWDGNLTLEKRIAALKIIREDIGECTRCALHKGRNKLVFADGSPLARLMFIGEGPGADEDAQGLPFVGRAGQLLNNMIGAMGLKREEVYIANVVKCRPPGNRTPEPDEANTCSPFLFRQIDVVKPEVIVALGATAATYLLGARQPLAGLRGRVHNVRGVKLIVTYHPAYLLRDPRQKKEAWADLQIAMRELGLKAAGRESK